MKLAIGLLLSSAAFATPSYATECTQKSDPRALAAQFLSVRISPDQKLATVVQNGLSATKIVGVLVCEVPSSLGHGNVNGGINPSYEVLICGGTLTEEPLPHINRAINFNLRYLPVQGNSFEGTLSEYTERGVRDFAELSCVK